MAEELDIRNFSGLRKPDLIFRIEQNLLDSDVVLRGEGVLEILWDEGHHEHHRARLNDVALEVPARQARGVVGERAQHKTIG